MPMQTDFWLQLHNLAESLRAEGSDRAARQAALSDSYESMVPLARHELTADYRLVISDLRAFEPQFLALSLARAAADERSARK